MIVRVVANAFSRFQGGEHSKQQPGLLGTTENELGIRKWLESQGHTLVTTSDKDREGSKFDQELVDAEVIITTPFHPGYLTAERLAKAKKLKIAVTAGIGSDHVDLDAANKTNGGITVAEVTGSNVVSVAEHVIMTMLTLVRNFVPAHDQVSCFPFLATKNGGFLSNYSYFIKKISLIFIH